MRNRLAALALVPPTTGRTTPVMTGLMRAIKSRSVSIGHIFLYTDFAKERRFVGMLLTLS